MDDVVAQIRERTARGERALITTMTKRMAEDLTSYLQDIGIRVQYLHSEIQTVERVEILRDLRRGQYDVVVGINLLREGLDLPEVSLVAILDADKEGFLRSETALTQTIGRAARHVSGKVIMYADKMTDSMKKAIEETDRRREKQVAHNLAHGIEPVSIHKAIHDLTERVRVAEGGPGYDANKGTGGFSLDNLPKDEAQALLLELEKQMTQLAKDLEFEKAAMLRDQILELRQKVMDIDDNTPEWERWRKLGAAAARDSLAAETTSSESGEVVTYRQGKPSKSRPGPARSRTRK